MPVLALRVTYVGELGWELYAADRVRPAALGRRSGRPAGRTGSSPAGYRAIDALRLEKGYRVWSSDITPDETPFEAGLGFAVALDKGVDFIGREALRRGEGRRPAQAAALPRPRRSALGLPRQRAGPDRRRRSSAG